MGRWWSNFSYSDSSELVESLLPSESNQPGVSTFSSDLVKKGNRGDDADLQRFSLLCIHIWDTSRKMRACAYRGDLRGAVERGITLVPLMDSVESYRFGGISGFPYDEPRNPVDAERELGKTISTIKYATKEYGLTTEAASELTVALMYKDGATENHVISPAVALAAAFSGTACDHLRAPLSKLTPQARLMLATSYKFGQPAPIGSLAALPPHFVFDAVALDLDDWMAATKSLQKAGWASPFATADTLLPEHQKAELLKCAKQLGFAAQKSQSKAEIIDGIQSVFGGAAQMNERVRQVAPSNQPTQYLVELRRSELVEETESDPEAAVIADLVNYPHRRSSDVAIGVPDASLDRLRLDLRELVDKFNS